jgi:hypothetical protein
MGSLFSSTKQKEKIKEYIISDGTTIPFKQCIRYNKDYGYLCINCVHNENFNVSLLFKIVENRNGFYSILTENKGIQRLYWLRTDYHMGCYRRNDGNLILLFYFMDKWHYFNLATEILEQIDNVSTANINARELLNSPNRTRVTVSQRIDFTTSPNDCLSLYTMQVLSKLVTVFLRKS